MNWHNCPECGRPRPILDENANSNGPRYLRCCGKYQAVPAIGIISKTQAAAMQDYIAQLERENAELRGKR